MSVVDASGAPRLVSPRRASASLMAIALSVVTMSAQHPVPAGVSARALASPGADIESSELQLLVGRSMVVNVGTTITRVSLTSPDIADALVTTSNQLLVHGKTPGTISMFVWDRAGSIRRYEVVVKRDLSQLVAQMVQLFPGEAITVTSNGTDVVIAGTVSSKYVVEKAAAVASGYVENKDDVVNLLRQQEGIASNQVLLRVRFAEINRSAMTDLGVNLFSDGKNQKIGSSGTQQFPMPFFDQRQPMVGDHMIFSDYLNLFFFDQVNQLGAVVKALQAKGLFQMLAEPNLIAENGKEASFLAGGEYPYPVAQGGAGNLSITIVFKEFGIRLRFTPTVLGGDLIHLKVMPEVSSLDFSNAVVANGFRIPSLSTRRAETEIELRDGQTFAIAGLMNNTVASSLQKVPGIGDIPVLGLLFRSKAASKDQTELVVMITPQIIRQGSMGAAPGLPRLNEPFLPIPRNTIPPPDPWLGPVNPASPQAAPMAAPSTSNAATPVPRVVSTVGPREVVSASPAPVAAPEAANQAPSPAVAAPAPAPAPASSTASAPSPIGTAGPGVMTPAEQQQFDRARRDLEQANAAKSPAVKPAGPSKEEQRAMEQARRELEKQRDADLKQKKAEAKRAAEEARFARERAEEQRREAEAQQRADEKARKRAEEEAARQAAKEAAEQVKRGEELARQRAAEEKRQTEIAKEQAAIAKRQAEVEARKAAEIIEAELRLKEAQAAYKAEVAKSKKSTSQVPANQK
jgi:pilus assembly protein CpaC